MLPSPESKEAKEKTNDRKADVVGYEPTHLPFLLLSVSRGHDVSREVLFEMFDAVCSNCSPIALAGARSDMNYLL
jgi:hypothetical protein